MYFLSCTSQTKLNLEQFKEQDKKPSHQGFKVSSSSYLFETWLYQNHMFNLKLLNNRTKSISEINSMCRKENIHLILGTYVGCPHILIIVIKTFLWLFCKKCSSLSLHLQKCLPVYKSSGAIGQSNCHGIFVIYYLVPS